MPWSFGWDSIIVNTQNPLITNHFVHMYTTTKEHHIYALLKIHLSLTMKTPTS